MDASFDYVRRIIPATETMFLVPGQWWLSGASVDLYFSSSLYYDSAAGGEGQAVTSYLSCVRASVGYATTAAGTLTQFGTNTLRITDLGLLVEDTRTNVVLWNRDLTNVLWVAVNITAALDQTGVDGGSNSASSITATAGNGTILQTIVLASSARYQSAYVKRITGSGTINMTMDNGATWTAVTVTSAWTRVEIPTQTLANPIVGFRIVTNGDKIAVDFVQNEDGAYASSPILTTTGSQTRAADAIDIIGTAATLIGSTASARVVVDFLNIRIFHDNLRVLSVHNGGSEMVIGLEQNGWHIRTTSPALDTANAISNNRTNSAAAIGWSGAGRSLVVDGGTVATDSNFPNTAGTPRLTEVNFIERQQIGRLTLWNSRLADATLQGFTDP